MDKIMNKKMLKFLEDLMDSLCGEVLQRDFKKVSVDKLINLYFRVDDEIRYLRRKLEEEE